MNPQDLTQEEVDELLNKDIIDVLGLSDLPEDQKNDMRDKITETAQNRAFARMMDEVNKKGKKAEFDALTDDADIDRFFEDNEILPDLYFIQEALKYKIELKAIANLASKSVAAADPIDNTIDNVDAY